MTDLMRFPQTQGIVDTVKEAKTGSENIPIPVTLLDTLEHHFEGQRFTLFSILTHAKSDQLDEWLSALKVMFANGTLECVCHGKFGDLFMLSRQGGAV